MPIKDTWEIRGWEVIPLLLSADSLGRIIPKNGCWGMHSLQKEMLLLWSPVQNRAPWEEGSQAGWVSAVPLNAGTAGAALAVEIFISRNRSSISPTTANNTRLAFIATEQMMEIRESMELAFWRRALGFFFTIYLFMGPTESAFKEANFFHICISLQLMAGSFVLSTNPILSAVYSL